MTDTSSRPIEIRTEQALRAGAKTPSGAVSFCDAYVFKKQDQRLIPLDLDRVRELVEIGDQLRFDIGWQGVGDAATAEAVLDATTTQQDDARAASWKRVDARHIVDVTEIKDDGTISGTSRFEPA